MILLAILGAISGSILLNVIIWLIVCGVIFWLVNWAIGYIGIPSPFDKVIRVVLALAVLIILINALLSLTGSGGFIKW